MRKLYVIFLGLLFSLGCVMTPEGTDIVEAHNLKPGVIVPQLRVGVRVLISITASGEPVMEETVKEVSASGDIMLPYIQSIRCAGMTIEAFQEELTRRYREYYVDPLVSALYVPESEGGSSPYGSVLVTGCVRQQGVVSIPKTCDLTVLHALQAAGGMGEWANRNGVRLTRSFEDGTKQQVVIDTEAIGRRGETELNILLMPGDVLDVPESNW